MNRTAWVIAALFYIAGVLSTVIVWQIFGGSASLHLAAKVGASPGKPDGKTEPASVQSPFQNARQAITRALREPGSAQFGRIFEGRGIIGKATICGEVNAKNGFGGYTGMTPFVYFPADDRAELVTDPVTLQMTREGIDAYFKDCRRS